jgi:hypothetical protein
MPKDSTFSSPGVLKLISPEDAKQLGTFGDSHEFGNPSSDFDPEGKPSYEQTMVLVMSPRLNAELSDLEGLRPTRADELEVPSPPQTGVSFSPGSMPVQENLSRGSLIRRRYWGRY